MTAPEGTLLLVNREARQGETDLASLHDRLEPVAPLISPPVSGKREMQAVIRQHASTVERVVIGGGDGTVHGALPALLKAKLPLGVLPLGTANDFARSLGINGVDEAVRVICDGHCRSVDVGVVNDVYFLNAAGIGLGPRITRELDRQTKASFGVLGYFLRFLRSERRGRGMHATVSCDGRIVQMKSLQITIGNGIHYGGGMTIAKDARLDDGILDLISIAPQSTWSLLMRGPALRSGKLEGNDYVQSLRGRFISVRTRHTMDVTADGELVTRTPVECRALERVLTVFAPLD